MSEQPMRDALERMVEWLERLAGRADVRAADKRFMTLADAAAADAKNYRATAADLRAALAADSVEMPRDLAEELMPDIWYNEGQEGPFSCQACGSRGTKRETEDEPDIKHRSDCARVRLRALLDDKEPT